MGRLEVPPRADELGAQEPARVAGRDQLLEEIAGALGSDLGVAVPDQEEEADARRNRAQVQAGVEQDREHGEHGARRPDLRRERRVVDREPAAARIADQHDREALRQLGSSRRKSVVEEAQGPRVARDGFVTRVQNRVPLRRQVAKPGPVVVGGVLARVAAAVDEDDHRLRLTTRLLEQPHLVSAPTDTGLAHARRGRP